MLGEVLTAIVTPFSADGSVNFDKFRELAIYLVDHGSDGVVVAGTTGESPTLSDDEKLELFAAAVDAVGTPRDVSSPARARTTRATRRSSPSVRTSSASMRSSSSRRTTASRRSARSCGTFEEIAARTDKPIVVYNIPSRVVVNIEPETIAELAKIENVQRGETGTRRSRAGAAHSRLRPRPLRRRRQPHLPVPASSAAIGGICVHTHVWGPQTKEMVRRYKDGDVDGARQLNDEMAPAYDLLKVQTNPIAIKAALNLLGHEVGGYRLPMVEPTEQELDQVRGCLERAGILSAASA